MDATADLTLWPSDKKFFLPPEGTPSLLFRFGGPDGVTLGARATDPSGVPFAPGTDHGGVRLEFWADEAEDLVALAHHSTCGTPGISAPVTSRRWPERPNESGAAGPRSG